MSRKIARTVSKAWTIAVILVLFPFAGKAQVSPFGGLGQVQFFDNSGNVLTNGVLYSYQAGTTTQQATFTDSSGSTQNVNPITFGAGARVQIWLTTANLYKFVLCLQNDGPFCAAQDILFSIDNVPGGSTSSGGGGSCATGCTGFFISGSASPATSGTLRLASGDSTCWRNASGSTNICWSKTGNDILQWAGGSVQFAQVAAPSSCGLAGFDCLWADNTANRWMAKSNGGTAAQLVLSGNDVDVTDAVTKWHFGATQVPLSATAPTTGQYLQWNGSAIVGTTNTAVPVVQVDLTGQTANIGLTTLTTPAANGFYRASCFIVETAIAGTSSQLPSCAIGFTSADGSIAIGPLNLTSTNATNTVGTIGGFGVFWGWMYAKSGTAIQYQTLSYTSNPAATMTYAIHIRLEGPF